jgi:hypothetical protein
MKWRRYRIFLFVFVVLAGTAFLGTWFYFFEPMEEGVCKLRHTRFPLEKAGALAVRYYRTLAEQPDAIKDVPNNLSSKVRFFGIRLPKLELPGCIDQQGKAFVLYLDTNANGMLSDEQCIRGSIKTTRFPDSNEKTWRFGPITLRFGGEKWEYWRFGPIILGDDSSPSNKNTQFLLLADSLELIQVYPVDSYNGKIRLGGKVYEVLLMDSDYDGQYRTIFSAECVQQRWPDCDSIAFDYNQDGLFRHVSFHSMEEIPLPRMLKIEGQYYAVDLSEDMRCLTLVNTEPEFGTVVFSVPNINVCLLSDAFSGYIDTNNGAYSLPAGHYSTHRFKTRVKVEDDEWEMNCRYNTGQLKYFEIKPEQTTRLEFGPPLTAKVEVLRQESEISLDLKLFGSGGEMYQPNILRNSEVVKEPSFSIVDENDTVLETGRFKYG